AEALEKFRMGVEGFADDLDRDGPVEGALTSPEQRAHPALAERLIFEDVEVSGVILLAADLGDLPGTDGFAGLAERFEQLRRLRVAVDRRLGKAAKDRAFQLLGDRGAQGPRSDGIDVKQLVKKRRG